ncbi:MAG TPA: ribonuclease III [Bryobacteraceae bacterium]|jgi:ribonuclease-3|nr:ribonuclease III [Bryobacteraceae bacterium]
MPDSVAALEEKLGFHFADPKLLLRALTHRSWSAEQTGTPPHCGDNEQLEFLGDSILGFVVSEVLFLRYPSATEGRLSQIKAHLVSARHLYQCANALRLGDFLQLGRGEERNGGRERKTLLANALEALIAAMHLDGGLEVTRDFIQNHILGALDRLEELGPAALLNYKSLLQEQTQALGLPLPRYLMIAAGGPEHAKLFTVEARVNEHWCARATASSKKAASQLAAESLYEKLNRDRNGALASNIL